MKVFRIISILSALSSVVATARKLRKWHDMKQVNSTNEDRTRQLQQQSFPSNNPAFIAKNGLIVMDAESVPIVSPWKLETNVRGYTGPGFLRFDGNDPYGGSPNGMLSFFFQIGTAGRYKLVMRLRKDGDVSHIANDCYIRVPGQKEHLGQITKAFLPGRFPRNTWKWFTRLEVDHDAGIYSDPIYDFTPGTYELQVWGRSRNFFVDRIILYNQGTVSFDYARDLARQESRRVGDSSAVSATPTQSPTLAPVTRVPTRSPVSPRPTVGPTTAPVTAAPSLAPVSSPPTLAPTMAPSGTPTTSPITADPTARPSASPTTTAPSQEPTKAPASAVPSKAPTKPPATFAPSRSPMTPTPSASPTTSPLAREPTGSPTTRVVTQSPIAPTRSPVSPRPTVGPTIAPVTAAPSLAPVSSPPTLAPTMAPSGTPTTSPIMADPTARPSASPTTTAPSQEPTKAPAFAVPSKAPTKPPATFAPSTPTPSASPTTSPLARKPTGSPAVANPIAPPTTRPAILSSESSSSPIAQPSPATIPPKSGATSVPSSLSQTNAPSAFDWDSWSTRFNNSECFSSENTAQMVNGEKRSINDLTVGDYVLTSSGYSRVYSLGHHNTEATADFLQISFNVSKEVLEITGGHLLFVGGALLRADSVKVGQIVGGDVVTAIHTVRRRGVFAPVTEQGDIYVSGFLASCFASVLPEYSGRLQHQFAQLLLLPRKLTCMLNFGICQREKLIDGRPDFVWNIANNIFNAREHSTFMIIFLGCVVGLFVTWVTLLVWNLRELGFPRILALLSLDTLSALRNTSSEKPKQF